MDNKKIRIMLLCSIAVAINIVLGIVTSSLKLPLYLDTIGTVLIAVYYGPLAGATVGALTNILTGIIFNPKDIPFLLVNVAVGIIVGFIAKKFKFNMVTALITGLTLSIVCPLIGTPIGVWIYGGLTGTGTDFLVLWLQKVGQSLYFSSFIGKVFNNLLDKVGTCMLVSLLISYIPKSVVYKQDEISK